MYNSKGQAIERTQELLHPALSSVDQAAWAASISISSANSTSVKAFLRKQHPFMTLYWGAYWHMTTPLQNIDAGSFVLVELRDGDADPGAAAAYWARYAINFVTINSTYDEALPLGVVPNSTSAASRRAMLTGPAPTAANTSTSSGGGGGGGGSSVRESFTGRGTLTSKASRNTMSTSKAAVGAAESEPTDSLDASGGAATFGSEISAPKSSLLFVDCVLHQHDRVVGIDHVINN